MISTPIIDKPDIAGALEFFDNKNAYTTGPMEVHHMMEEAGEEFQVIDVRKAEDYAQGHVPGAISLPRGSWEEAQRLSKDRTNVLYCYTQTCHLAAKAAAEFARRGYPVMEMEGGFKTWKESDLPVEK